MKKHPGHISYIFFLFCWSFNYNRFLFKVKFFSDILLIPFIDIIRGPKDAILNIILFLPLGIFLPILYDKYNSISRVLLLGFLFSLSIEIIQMFNFGITDINDLITNTVVAGLGYGVYKFINKSFHDLLIRSFK